ncbi:arsenate reductase ArsC [Chloroherpeton thalassium]|uniref:arsenate reductase ArsC n=1 Tax=Chloroherpeton thalassium TaxID=100716 RepID=UPI00031C2EE2|nr:arsenate reductase ArsC [Chloroherpeton thalassium]
MLTENRRSILFICTANSIRSQIAEAIVNAKSDQLIAYSAGIRPVGFVDGRVVDVMAEIGISMDSHESKGLDEFKDKQVDISITMCGTAYAQCPYWLYDSSLSGHWGFKDVSRKGKSAFRHLRDQIQVHIQKFLVEYSPELTDEEVKALLRKHML